nr:MAG TPA: hypothetical protein [Caudoviricetes sp.]
MNSGYICPSGEKSLSEFSLRCCRLSEAFNRSISNKKSGIFLDWNIPLFFYVEKLAMVNKSLAEKHDGIKLVKAN